MFGIFNKKPKGEIITFNIEGMHCVSCGMNIDGELEDLDGVLESSTSYAKARCRVTYNPQLVSPAKIKKTISSLGYYASLFG